MTKNEQSELLSRRTYFSVSPTAFDFRFSNAGDTNARGDFSPIFFSVDRP